ncbi:hypothetical protein [Rubrobacter calidifluminis]|uniref:hypothetical protein n=1 Tax=Rubrobacter calidifluminis TaxID=1392640 RepID=UPI00235E88B8|nr:hypothetical protein [Rubrobacter calidifluminis]
MTDQWRLALGYALRVSVVAVVVGAGLVYVYGVVVAGAFEYGVGVGLVSLISTALTVTLLTTSSWLGRGCGVGSFFLRYGFDALALGIPAFLGLWPVVAMLSGFTMVYLAEIVLLVPRAVAGGAVRRAPGSEAVGELVERRAKI